jgi:hypothetical protein
MKIIKPLKLGILTRVFEHGRDPMLVVTVFAAFPFDEPRALFTEQALWRTMGEELGPGGAFDVGLPKPRGEVIVDAIAYTPNASPQPGVSVEIEIATVKKRLWVAGHRRWEILGMTMPEPFMEMPVDWAHAFGGEGFSLNPLGKGAGPVVDADGKKHHPLPNVEDGSSHVLAVLERKPGRPAVLSAEGDVSIRATGRLQLSGHEGVDLVTRGEANVVASEVSVHAERGSLTVDAMRVIGGLIAGDVDRIKVVARAIDQVVDRFSQRVKASYRTIEELDRVRAKNVDHVASGTMKVHARETVMTADGLVKMDAEQIHVG